MPTPRLILRHLAPSRRPILSASSSQSILSSQQSRHESTTRTHKKLLFLPPAPSYIPSPSTVTPSPQLIYNPPSAAPSIYHTPLKFLPPTDKRRLLFAQHQKEMAQKQLRERASPVAVTGTALSASSAPEKCSILHAIAAANISQKTTSSKPSKDPLPPIIGPLHNKKYHITAEQVEEIRALRQKDPDTWTVAKLAKKYNCSPIFLSMFAKNPEKAKRVKAELEKAKTRWGPRRKMAREDRERRRAMWGRE